MEGKDFLTTYMQQYADDYILIGGNACVLNFENIGANFRATVDLDIVLITESTNDQFYEHLWNYIIEHGYEGKVYRGSNAGGSAYRFIQPEDNRVPNVPAQIELFSRKPDYFDAALAKSPHITQIRTGQGISNFSAILLDDDVYKFIRSSRIQLKGISTVNLECLFGLKSVAWHSNQALFDENKINDRNTVLKHPQDMISIANVIEEAKETLFPAQIFDSLRHSRERLLSQDVRAELQAAPRDIDVTIDYIDTFVRKQQV
ncbi:hypothetical protein I5N09_09915 [Serratia marcescens]|uniref:hypothetical protein n=1 Tax=Serratia marcescens TaxID=615 RepID=UPI000CDE1C27|nr:hypothetical protein [Serratia marcescens]MBH3099266.1 hypothetical protein [Serratia marcescens]MBH3218331.1 hypothetical protein [Serratia marcescens]POW84406.1 hypothetical protein C3461_24045 [Serratia marcescens]POW89141.1 hypothetical protein C3459_24030 [Serratia marcescens]POX03285.1 hypothetical protein C3458_24055 [Serratia marcescens]